MEEEVKTDEMTEDVTEEVEETADEEDYTADIDESDDLEEDDEEEFDIEYDEDGNVGIEDDAEEAGDTTPQTEPEKDSDTAPADGEADAMRRELDAFKEKARAALKSLGYTGENLETELETISAEANGQTVEAYRADREKERLANEGRAARLEAQKASDLSAVRAAYPFASKYARVEDFPHFDQFAEYCDKGVSPVDAFRATHYKEIADDVAASVRQSSRDSKAHLSSVVPQRAKDTSVRISASDMASLRETFPGMSDKEIAALYKRASANKK
ncbi:MAG: hypothetical protein IIY01_01830 [Clostridia bacterium]|nr:hypothetical protein [Clostridia bacterium]